jgi:casein kinase 1
MIDFGFSKIYIDPETKRHIPDSKVKRDFLGNYWFTSIGVHCKGKGALLTFLPVFNEDAALMEF